MIRVDHGSLHWLMNFKNPEGQMWRWLQVMNTFDFEIHHRPGSQHKNADGLSHRPCQGCSHCEKQESKEESLKYQSHHVCAVRQELSPSEGQWCEPWSQE